MTVSNFVENVLSIRTELNGMFLATVFAKVINCGTNERNCPKPHKRENLIPNTGETE